MYISTHKSKENGTIQNHSLTGLFRINSKANSKLTRMKKANLLLERDSFVISKKS